MLFPLTLCEYLLAIWTLLLANCFVLGRISCSRLGSCLSYVVFLYLHVWVKSRTFRHVLLLHFNLSYELLCSILVRICLDFIICFFLRSNSNLIRVWHALEFFIFLHMQSDLLLKQGWLPIVVVRWCQFSHQLLRFLLFCHLFVIIQFNLLDHDEIVPVNVFWLHLAVLVVLGVEVCLLPRQLLLLCLVHLAMLTCLVDFKEPIRWIGESLISLQGFIFRMLNPTVRFDEISEVIE